MSTQQAGKGDLIKLRGVISDYKKTRASANFVLTSSNTFRIGVIAVVANIVGLSGQSVSLASASSTEEEADYIEFDLSGNCIKGWVWRSPFSKGDEVELVAEWRGAHFECFGIIRPKDRIIALYPHCSRGRVGHWINALKWWFVGVSFVSVTGAAMVAGIGLLDSDSIDGALATYFILVTAMPVFFYPFFLLMTISLAWKWMAFVKLAEHVFTALELKRPTLIDLRKISKKSKSLEDGEGFGIFYFRY